MAITHCSVEFISAPDIKVTYTHLNLKFDILGQFLALIILSQEILEKFEFLPIKSRILRAKRNREGYRKDMVGYDDFWKQQNSIQNSKPGLKVSVSLY